jgi:hypothetical protein
MIEFDKRGNLKPYKVNEVSLEYFAKTFTSIENQEHRQFMFSKYLDYIHDVASILKCPFFQLIDGSYIFKNDYQMI